MRAWFVFAALAFASAAAAQPIALETLFEVPEYESLRLSPDGTHLAAIIPISGPHNVAVIDLRKMEAHAITGYSSQDVVNFVRINNRRLLVDVGHLPDASEKFLARNLGS